MSLSIELTNPSPICVMRVSTEDRMTEADFEAEAETVRAAPRPANAVMSEAERAEYVGRGIDIVPAKNGAGHAIRVERWRANGFSSLAQYVTQCFEETKRPTYQAPARRGTRVLDEWKDPVAITTLAPAAKAKVTLTANRRIVANCDSPDDVGLQIENVDVRQTVRLRARNMESGEESQVAFLAANGPSNCGAVSLNKATAAVIELMPA